MAGAYFANNVPFAGAVALIPAAARPDTDVQAQSIEPVAAVAGTNATAKGTAVAAPAAERT